MRKALSIIISTALVITSSLALTETAFAVDYVNTPEPDWSSIQEPEIKDPEPILEDDDTEQAELNSGSSLPDGISADSSETDKMLYVSEMIKQALLSGDDTVSLEGLGLNYATQEQFHHLYFYCPYLDGNNINISLRVYSNNDYSRVVISNKLSDEETVSWINTIDNKISNLLSLVDENGLSVSDQALILHDYMDAHYHYDLQFESYYPSIMLTEQKGVCQSYAYLFQYIMNLKGIECYTAVSDEMNHAWNIIGFNGKYYHIDVTWDDPTRDYYGMARHSHFLLSDNTIRNMDNPHHDWDITEYVCNDTSYENCYYSLATSPVIFDGSDRYFIDSEGLEKYNTSDKSSTNLTAIDDWYVWNNAYSCYGGKYSGLFEYENKLYYNSTDAINTYNIDDGNISSLTAIDTSNGYAYGCVREGNKVYYSIETAPGRTDYPDKTIQSFELHEEEPEHQHSWDNGVVTKEPTCTEDGMKTFTCSGCDATRTTRIAAKGHKVGNVNIIKATATENGSVDYYCSVCGEKYYSTLTTHPDLIKLSYTAVTYSGSAKTPAVSIFDSDGDEIDPEFYSVEYVNNVKVGSATVIITLDEEYYSDVVLNKTFKINPKGTSISGLSRYSKAFTVKWKKQATQTTGYQIRYSLKSSMASPKTVTISKTSTVSKKITKLKSKKKYYVQVRTYKTVNGTKYYSAWSTKKSVTTK